MRSIIILDQGDIRFNFYPSVDNINSQIVIKSGEYSYNFNADVADSLIGICQSSDMLLLSLGCTPGVTYKRECSLDPPQLTIIQEGDGPIAGHWQARRTYVNNVNDIRLTVEN